MKAGANMKLAIVIGAGKIGSAIASHLRSTGYEVSLVGHDAIELRNEWSIERLFGTCGPISLLVNAAGVYGAVGKVGDVSPRQWVRAFEVNTLGVYTACYYALPKLVPGAHIINLAGGGAVTPVSHLSGYGASKAALVRLTETLAAEYPQFRANCISPGPIVSRMQQQLLAAGPANPHYAKIKAMCDAGVDEVPLARTLEVIDAILESGVTGKLFFARTFQRSQIAQAA
jgi:NAD(P)-dependent dehydrogenase (short-subunit alcohol dehydrogenase family)